MKKISLFPCSSILHVVVALLFLFFSIESMTVLCSKSTVLGDGDGDGDGGSCINSERLALLDFKSGLVVGPDELSDWSSDENNTNCCEWSGVQCSDQTGHVITLNPYISGPVSGKIGPSLLQLRHLNYLSLNEIDFGNASIPNFIGSFSELVHLDLSHSNFAGSIPSQLGNLSRLEHLDLSHSNLSGNIPSQLGNLSSLHFLDISNNSFDLKADNLEWLSNLSLLESLNMDGTDLSNVTRWPGILMNLPSLSYLSLCRCKLGKFLIPYDHSSSISINSSITKLDLSNNYLTPSIYHWLFNLSTTLVELYLPDNQLTGPIPEAFKNMTSLMQLDLSSNQLTGTFPKFLGNLFNLNRLSLNNNLLNGSLPENMGMLINLEVFDVSSNSLEGVVSETHFLHLAELLYLRLSLNSITFEVSSQWVPPFQLYYIDLRSCKLGPRFPNWLQTQKYIHFLDISCTGISDIIPARFGDQLLFELDYLNVSSNQIQGTLPNLSSQIVNHIDLSCNHFEGAIQWLPSGLSSISLHQNNFSGDLSFLCHLRDSNLTFLDLSQNLLTGKLPDCVSNFYDLRLLNFAHNKLHGKIPTSIGSLYQLEVLNLYNNSFDGELPLQLSNCTRLSYLNVGANKLSGNIAPWIGQNLTLLYILNLRSNNFSGTIPLELCHLSDLLVLDLSVNGLAGTIPSCFNNFTSMVQEGHHLVEGITGSMHVDYATIDWQGREQEFNKNLTILTIIDLSSNYLTGVIPDEVALLHELVALNISRNQLDGAIPQKIGELKSLLALDISRNHLSGGIPTSLSEISSLSWLDLSYNNLSGSIPTSTQLQSFNASQFIGNAGLCGPPLTQSCSRDEAPLSSNAEDTNEFWRWFYVGFTGFACHWILDNIWSFTS